VKTPLKIIVLVSGNGSNLQAIIDAIESQALNVEIVALISNKTKAYALERARKHSIPAYVLPTRKKQVRVNYDSELAAVIQRIDEQSGFDLIVLAGFMRIFSEQFVTQFSQRIINIHPSLLPKHKGLNTHLKALKASDKEHGCSIHFVTPELDGGPIIAQAQTLIETEDNITSLSAKVQALEHKIYPLVLKWFAQGRIHFVNNEIHFDGTVLKKPLLINSTLEVEV